MVCASPLDLYAGQNFLCSPWGPVSMRAALAGGGGSHGESAMDNLILSPPRIPYFLDSSKGRRRLIQTFATLSDINLTTSIELS